MNNTDYGQILEYNDPENDNEYKYLKKSKKLYNFIINKIKKDILLHTDNCKSIQREILEYISYHRFIDYSDWADSKTLAQCINDIRQYLNSDEVKYYLNIILMNCSVQNRTNFITTFIEVLNNTDYIQYLDDRKDEHNPFIIFAQTEYDEMIYQLKKKLNVSDDTFIGGRFGKRFY